MLPRSHAVIVHFVIELCYNDSSETSDRECVENNEVEGCLVYLRKT